MDLGSNPAAATSLRNFGNSVYPALPVFFGGDTKSRRSLLSGFYARGSFECSDRLDHGLYKNIPLLVPPREEDHASVLYCIVLVHSGIHCIVILPREEDHDSVLYCIVLVHSGIHCIVIPPGRKTMTLYCIVLSSCTQGYIVLLFPPGRKTMTLYCIVLVHPGMHCIVIPPREEDHDSVLYCQCSK